MYKNGITDQWRKYILGRGGKHSKLGSSIYKVLRHERQGISKKETELSVMGGEVQSLRQQRSEADFQDWLTKQMISMAC